MWSRASFAAALRWLRLERAAQRFAEYILSGRYFSQATPSLSRSSPRFAV